MVLQLVIRDGSAENLNKPIKPLMFTLIVVRIAAVKIFRHATTLLNISRKILKTASRFRLALFIVITGVPIAGKLFMVGEQMKFPMPLLGQMPELRLLFCAMKSRFLMTMFNELCNICAA